MRTTSKNTTSEISTSFSWHTLQPSHLASRKLELISVKIYKEKLEA